MCKMLNSACCTYTSFAIVLSLTTKRIKAGKTKMLTKTESLICIKGFAIL